MRRFILLAFVVTLVSVPAQAFEQLVSLSNGISIPSIDVVIQDQEQQGADPDKEQENQVDEEEEEITLERLFPEKSYFGTSARSISFSHDGRYAAYMYRPYIERRHGNDLWIYDTETGETRRVTSVSVMSEFQEKTRKVKEDRIKKAKKGGKSKKAKKADDEGADGETVELDDDFVDPLSGDWEGRITGGEELGLPPDGITFTMEILLHDDLSLTGIVETSYIDLIIMDGRFDPDTSTIECTLGVEDSDISAVFTAVIEDDTLDGLVFVESMEAELAVTATRVAVAEVDEDGEEDGDEVVEEDVEEEEVDVEGDEEEIDEGDGDDEEEVELGDVVDEKDADDKKAPRYGGISTYVWAPETNRLIFTSGGDLYLYEAEEQTIDRLTRTRRSEYRVQFLPDGSGYTYLQDSALIRVRFGSHLIEQLDPKLPGGESMDDYRISPDGTRLTFLASKGTSPWSQGQQVNIVNYRGRFAQVNQVTRHMSDDPLANFEWFVYLYDLTDDLYEKHEPKKVYSHKQSGMRDIMRVPEWAPDSSRVAFAVFEQSTGHEEIYEAAFVLKEEPEAEVEEPEESADDEEIVDHGDGEEESEEATDEPVEEPEPEYEIEDARVVYRFLHNGGPNTPAMIHPQYLWDSRRIVFISELSGFRHLHVLDPTYEHLDQLTRGRFEVYPFDISEDHRTVFATSTKVSPVQQDIYRIDLDSGDMTRLSTQDGYYSSTAVSDDGQHVLANFVDFGLMRELVAIDCETGDQETLTDSHPEEGHKLTSWVPEYFTYENRHGQEIHGHMFKPDGWTAEDQRPLLIYVYGGPLGTSKMATRGMYSGSSYFFAYYMAKQHGFVTCTIDPRGASGYGGLFEKSNFEQVGKPQVEDLVDATKWFVEHQGVDPKRIGMHGWSFGGFQTQMCLYTEPDVFACGIAGAGPTEWENYNSWYSTGTIGPSRQGKTDLAKFSLLPLAKNLKAKLLLIHGMEDSNVLYQDTVRVYRELLKAGKETLVELFLDPAGGHGLGGDVKSINRYRKYEDFLLNTLGVGEPVVDDEVEESEDVVVDDGESEDTEEGDGEEEDE